MAVSGLKFSVDGYDGDMEVVDFDVRQDAMPLDPGDSAGGVGDFTVSVRAITDGPPSKRTTGLVNRKAQLEEQVDVEYEAPLSRGLVTGKITRTQTAGAAFAGAHNRQRLPRAAGRAGHAAGGTVVPLPCSVFLRWIRSVPI